jgi:hypothetical protein
MMNPLSSQAPACCLAVVLAAGAAWAQQADDGGPVVVGEKNLSYKALELVRLDTHLDLLAQWRQDQVRGTGLPTLTETETLLRPTIDMNGEVYIGHKNLIDLMGTVKLGLEQDTLDSPATGTNNTSLSFTNEYDLNALVLGEGPVPTTVYSRRSENILHQDFGGSLTNTVNETGAIAQIRSAVAPTMLQLYHRDQDQTNQLGGGNYKVCSSTRPSTTSTRPGPRRSPIRTTTHRSTSRTC